MGEHGSAQLTFLGGAGTVTGSKFLLSYDGRRLLVDCGLFQGMRELRRQNWAPFPVAPESIDAVVISHAHLDHCGYLPALVRNGFVGRIYATPGTIDLARVVLIDSAHLLEEEARHAQEHGYSKHSQPMPLYTQAEAAQAISRFTPVAYGQTFTPIEGESDIQVTLRPAGHILGSSVVRVQVPGVGTVVFTGDLGRRSHPLLLPPEPLGEADVVVTESTYGDRRTEESDARQRFADAICRTVKRGGSVVIPAFAVDRTEIILHTLKELMADGQVPRIPVYVDSPMALAALEIYRKAIADGAPELRPDLALQGDPFDTGQLGELRTAEQSREMNEPAFPTILVSASGMATGGRVLHHLRHMLPEGRNTVLLVGFAAEGTRARDLLDGARVIKLLGGYVPVRAEVVGITGFSVHADRSELLSWLGAATRPPRIAYVVHGEPDASAALRDALDRRLGWTAVAPRQGERVRLP